MDGSRSTELREAQRAGPLAGSELLSLDILEFVQSCQVAVGACIQDDYARQFAAVWSCLDRFPRDRLTDTELSGAVVAIGKVAAGFVGHIPSDHGVEGRCARRHVNALLAIARREYANPQLTLTAFAMRLGVTQTYLSRTLNRETGHSFATHLNGIRLLTAIELIRQSRERLGNIAVLVGYRNMGELDRQFKKTFGLAPGRVRRLIGSWPPEETREATASPRDRTLVDGGKSLS